MDYTEKWFFNVCVLEKKMVTADSHSLYHLETLIAWWPGNKNWEEEKDEVLCRCLGHGFAELSTDAET